MKLKLQQSKVVPMNTLAVGEFGVLVEDYGSERAGTVVWAVHVEGLHFAVVGSPTLNKFYENATGRVLKLAEGDVLEITK